MTNPVNINELEKTKWMINRIDLLHKELIEQFTNDSKKYANSHNLPIEIKRI